ncbi:hypothetical protein DFS34DRAFT_318466 [Phlyctochytrium arcticum]|nr:hypothetical protein DFS34DRAFT_318466 [Phlyctochytrium arcticum]
MPELPLEIVLQILDYLLGGFWPSPDGHCRRECTLDRISRVGWVWRRATIPFLFREPLLRNLYAISRFADCLDARPEFGQHMRVFNDSPLWSRGYTKHFKVSDELRLLRVLLSACPNLEELELHCLYQSYTFNYFTSILDARRNIDPCSSRLTTLTLSHPGHGPDDLVMQLVCANPFLQRLNLYAMDLKLDTILTLLNICKHLTTLIPSWNCLSGQSTEILRAKPEHVRITFSPSRERSLSTLELPLPPNQLEVDCVLATRICYI